MPIIAFAKAFTWNLNPLLTSKTDIRTKTNEAIRMALEHGAYVGIASHDIPVVNYTLDVLNEFKDGAEFGRPSRQRWSTASWQRALVMNFKCSLVFEGPMRRKLTKQGHRTRVYIPYGEKWYEYSIRRLQRKSYNRFADCKGILDAMDKSSMITSVASSFADSKV